MTSPTATSACSTRRPGTGRLVASCTARRGFSLIELIVVSILIVILGAITVPRMVSLDRRQEDKALIEVEDLMRMFAFRNSVGTQQIALHYDRTRNTLSLWILDLNPEDPEGARVWQQDRLSYPVELPEGMTITEAAADDATLRDEIWTIASHPDGSRPRVAMLVEGRKVSGEIVLDSYSTVPVRIDKDGAIVREPIDLDAEGRTFDRW